MRKTVLVLTLLPLLLSLIALGITITRLTHETIERNEGEKLAAQARTVAEMVDAAIGHRLADLRSRAALLANLSLYRRPEALSLWLDTIQHHIPEYTWIGFAGADGTVLSASRGMLVGQQVGHREWFIRGRQRPATVDVHEAQMLSGLLGPHPSGSPWRFIDLSTPVFNNGGELIGVLGAHLSWDWLLAQHKRFIESIPKHLDAEIVVIGQDGNLRLTGPELQQASFQHLASVRAAQSGQRGWLREEWGSGHHYLVGYTHSPGHEDSHQLGWMTLIRLPIDAVNQQIAPVVSGIWIVVGAALVLFLAAMALLLSLTLKSTEQLARDIERIARDGGRLDTQRPAPREFQTLARATNQMIQSMEAQQAADQDKSRFIADMSHEIRTPLAGMIGLAELLRQRQAPGQDPQQRQDQRDLQALIGCGKALHQLLSDVIDFSAIAENRFKLESKPVQPHGLIAQQAEIFRGLADRKSVELRLRQRIEKDLWLMTDPVKLGQVIRNLISNAVKFTEKGWVEIRSRVSEAVNDTSENPSNDVILVIEIEDTGIGLSQAQQEIVFGRFQQAGHSISERYGGSGLGLTLARSLTEAMGGRLGLRSQAHEGTCFRIELGLKKTVAPDMPSGASRTEESGRPNAPSCRILIVDDVPMNREILARRLAREGYEARQASSGQDALRLCLAERFDVILMDIDLPDLSGHETARRIRASDGPCADSAIIALSGHAFAEDVSDSLAAGMDLHLSKPIDFDHLLGIIGQTQVVCDAARGRKTETS